MGATDIEFMANGSLIYCSSSVLATMSYNGTNYIPEHSISASLSKISVHGNRVGGMTSSMFYEYSLSSGIVEVDSIGIPGTSAMELASDVVAVGRIDSSMKLMTSAGNQSANHGAEEINGISISSDEDVIAFVGNDR